MVNDTENVVRVLFPNKVLHGRVMGGAFVLRAHRSERTISVFRMLGPTFSDDLMRLDENRNLHCAVMTTSEIRAVDFSLHGNRLRCDVIESGELEKTSHAGIVVLVNGSQLVGGHENEFPLKYDDGASMDALVLAMQHRLASLAQKGLTHVKDLLEI